MSVLAVVFLTAGAVYAAMVGAFALGLRRVLSEERKEAQSGALSDPPVPRSSDSPIPFVSVIVPARDEAAVIEGCVRSILANDYPADRFEVIVVDDLSEDATPALVRRLQAEVNAPAAVLADGEDEHPADGDRLRLLRMPDNLERTRAHKKRAIEKGIAHARGRLILTTDADCTAPTGWIRHMAAAFGDLDADPATTSVTAFVSGPVLLRAGRSPFLQMQALEFLGLVSVGAGAIGAGRPTICNGANVAYRRDVFEALGGFHGIDHLTSGDDELLMQKIHDTTPHRVRFCPDREAAVVTEPVPTLQAFFEQRRRWASKGAHYPNKRLVALFSAIYLFYLGLLVGLPAWPFVPALTPVLLPALALKLVPEAALLGRAAWHFGRARLFATYFLVSQLWQIPYIVVAATAGAWGNYEWKGRRVAR